MTIYTVKVASGSTIFNCDCIEHEGKLWLVPNWLDAPAEGVSMPSRLVRPLTQEFLPFGKEYVLSSPIPKELLDVKTPKLPIEGYEVRELPNIRIPLADRSRH